MSKVNISQVMEEIASITNQISGLNMLLSDRKNIMQKYFEESGNRQRETEDCTVYVQDRTTVKYDIEKLSKVLPLDVYKAVVESSASITDLREFTKLLRSFGLDKEQMQEVRKLLEVEKKVNQDELSKLYDEGKLTVDSLSGCYEAAVKKSIVVRMKSSKPKIPVKE